jgi:hypothetical protein
MMYSSLENVGVTVGIAYVVFTDGGLTIGPTRPATPAPEPVR